MSPELDRLRFQDVVARNTLAETNIARSTSRASNDSNRISIASQEDFKF